MNGGKNKRDPEERVTRMNEVFDKYIIPLVGFTLAVFIVFGLIAPAVRSCSAKAEQPGQSVREYSSAEFYVRRSLLLDGMVSGGDAGSGIFESGGYLLLDSEDGRKIAYKKLDSGDEVLENAADPSGGVYSAVISKDEYGEAAGKDNLTLMIYSGSLFLAIAEEEDGTCSALFDNESFAFEPSASDCRELLDKVPASEWSRMLEEYKDNLTPLLRQAG